MSSYNDLAKALRDDRPERPRRERHSSRNNGGWGPRTTGYVDGGHAVTFREGQGQNAGHTLIADGADKSARDFNRHHDHYGKNREDNERVEDHGGHRGNYTGPGH